LALLRCFRAAFHVYLPRCQCMLPVWMHVLTARGTFSTYTFGTSQSCLLATPSTATEVHTLKSRRLTVINKILLECVKNTLYNGISSNVDKGTLPLIRLMDFNFSRYCFLCSNSGLHHVSRHRIDIPKRSMSVSSRVTLLLGRIANMYCRKRVSQSQQTSSMLLSYGLQLLLLALLAAALLWVKALDLPPERTDGLG
jgi:hypothetical protein